MELFIDSCDAQMPATVRQRLATLAGELPVEAVRDCHPIVTELMTNG